MNLLAFDTATPATVVGLVSGDGRAEARHDPEPGERPQHASQLLALAARLLEEGGLRFDDLDQMPPVDPGGQGTAPGGDGGAAPGGSTPSTPGATNQLPNTGSDPRLIVLAGAALLLVGVGLRLRTIPEDAY